MVALARGCRKLQRLYLQENKLVSPAHLVSYFGLFSLLASGFLLVQEPKCLCVSVRQCEFISSLHGYSSQLCSCYWYSGVIRILWPSLSPFLLLVTVMLSTVTVPDAPSSNNYTTSLKVCQATSTLLHRFVHFCLASLNQLSQKTGRSVLLSYSSSNSYSLLLFVDKYVQLP